MVVFSKGNDSTWAPAQLFLSQHTGYQRIQWDQIKNTFDAQDATEPRGGSDGRTNLDHPKVSFVALGQDSALMDGSGVHFFGKARYASGKVDGA